MRSILRKLSIILISFLFVGTIFAADEDADAEEKEISYVELKPSIISNLTGGPEYIRADIQLMTEYASALEDIKLHMPAIRHSVLMLIAGEDGNKLKSREGKEGLRADSLAAVQKTLTELTGKPLVKDLFFSAYYVK